MWVVMVVSMVGGSLLFYLVPFLYVCNTFDLALEVHAMGPAEVQLRTSRQDNIHNTAGCRMVLV